LTEQGDLAGAQARFREALSIAPASSSAHRFLGKALLKSGDAPGAVAEYREAARLRPEDAQLRYELAQALDADQQRVEAVTELRRVLKGTPPLADGDAVRRLAEAALRRWGASP
jgi:Flp pilus assembly protein TadD